MVDNRWTGTRKGPGFLAVLRCGAEGGIRTRTVLPPPAPQAGRKDSSSQPTSVKRGRLFFSMVVRGRSGSRFTERFAQSCTRPRSFRTHQPPFRQAMCKRRRRLCVWASAERNREQPKGPARVAGMHGRETLLARRPWPGQFCLRTGIHSAGGNDD